MCTNTAVKRQVLNTIVDRCNIIDINDNINPLSAFDVLNYFYRIEFAFLYLFITVNYALSLKHTPM